MTDFTIGYGKDEIEPKIAPLVKAAREAGFATFSSCEGHPEDPNKPGYTSVAFYAHEDEARRVHEAFLGYRRRLSCSWVLRAGFVHRHDTDEWVLGWTLENCGFNEPMEDWDKFRQRTIEAAWHTDIPLLIEMFAELKPQK
jgi:hypothetical protein